jgi:hypothetical protein
MHGIYFLSLSDTPTPLSVAFLPVGSVTISFSTSFPSASLLPLSIEDMIHDTSLHPHHSGQITQIVPSELLSTPFINKVQFILQLLAS